MRVNARFDGDAEQQLMYLAQATGLGVSEVLRTSVQHYYDQLRAQRGGLSHFAAFVGQGAAAAGTWPAATRSAWPKPGPTSTRSGRLRCMRPPAVAGAQGPEGPKAPKGRA
jgi:hypothetical protein